MCFASFSVIFHQQFHLTTSLACLTRSPEKLIFHDCVACCAIGVSFQFFSVTLATGNLTPCSPYLHAQALPLIWDLRHTILTHGAYTLLLGTDWPQPVANLTVTTPPKPEI